MTTRGKLPPVALVIDDDPCIGALCARSLERVGLQVICCDTSVKAANVMQLHSHRIVCILADVVLARPGLEFMDATPPHEANGARLLPLLNYACQSAIAVQMSAHSVAELAAMGYKVEVPHFLQKPFTPETLRAMVKELAPHLNIPRILTLPADEVMWDL